MKKTFPKRAPWALAALVLWALLGGSAWAGSRVVYSWPSNVGPLNAHDYGANQMFAQAMVFQGLVKWDQEGVEPELAESWEISPDGRVYTFRLRPGVRFSNGQGFDASVAVANFDAIMARPWLHSWLGLPSQLESWEALEELTFQIRLKDPYYPTLMELALIRPFRFMAPASISTDGGLATQWGIGTGPWQLSQVLRGQQDLFIANPHYWGPKPALDEVMVRVIPDALARAMALETGEIDLILGASNGQIDMDSFQRFQSREDLVTHLSEPLATRLIAMNSGRFPTDDLAVRRAILQGVDKEALVERVFLGIERRADSLFPPSAPYCDLTLEPYRYDPQGAAEALDGAGWVLLPGESVRQKEGRPLALELCFIASDALQKAAAEVIQGDLRRLGIDVVLIGEEADSFYRRQRTGEFAMIFSSTWGAPYDPPLFCSSMRLPTHADYQAQLGLDSKAELDSKISQALATTGEGQRQELFRWILTELHRQAVYLPLTYSAAVAVHRQDLGGLRFGHLMDQIPFEELYRQEGRP